MQCRLFIGVDTCDEFYELSGETSATRYNKDNRRVLRHDSYDTFVQLTDYTSRQRREDSQDDDDGNQKAL